MTDSTASLSVEEVYLGRQPILDRNQSLYAFELLFRGSEEDKAIVDDNVTATSVVIVHTLSEFGIDAVLGKYAGFINCDAAFLQSDAIELLPPEKVVLEILETTIADEVVLRRCAELKQKGFRLALDDFQGTNDYNRGFLDFVDIVKVDIMGLSKERLREVALLLQSMRTGSHRIILLAEKVETKEEFRQCMDMGFDLYQGYFFFRAERVSGKRFTTAQMSIIQLLTMVQNDAEADKIVEAFKQNPTLSVGLLRLTNSASIGLRHVVTSIRSAVVLLGHKQLQRWLFLLLMAHGSTKEGPQTALIHQAAGRAKFMELMALSNKASVPYSESAFVTGMVSVMDALLGVEMETLMDSLGLAQEIRDALSERKGVLGNLLRLAEAIERADTPKIAEFVESRDKGGYGLLVRAQGQTVTWVNQIIDAGL